MGNASNSFFSEKKFKKDIYIAYDKFLICIEKEKIKKNHENHINRRTFLSLFLIVARGYARVG